MATRHLVRTVILQSLYEWDFYAQKKDLVVVLERNLEEFAPGIDEPDFAWRIMKGIVENLQNIDTIIRKAAPEWPLEKIAVIDRNILRIGLYELLYADREEVPPKVAINESIEMAKSFGGPNAGRFINGVLGTVYRTIKEDEKKKKEAAGGAVEVKNGARKKETKGPSTEESPASEMMPEKQPEE